MLFTKKTFSICKKENTTKIKGHDIYYNHRPK